MTLRTPARAFLLLAALTATPSLAQDATPTWTPEQQAIIDAASRGPVGIDTDFERWESGYHRDWSYWRLGAAETRPREEHMDLVRDYIGEGNRVVSFELTPIDVIVRGDVALLRYTAVETLAETNGETRIARYASATLLVKEDGRWLALASNLLHDLPEPE